MQKIDRIAIWDITSQCNLRCAHCYNQERYWENSNKYKELTSEDVRIIIDKLQKLNFTRLHLLGGEPLMSKQLYEIIEYGKKCNMIITMVTNGTLLSEKMVCDFCKMGVTSVNISLDGTTDKENDSIRGKGVFDIAIKNIRNGIVIKNKLNSDMNIGISFTLTKKNMENSKNIISFAEKLDLDFVNISYISQEGNARNNYNEKSVTEKEKFEFIDCVMEESKKRKSLLKLNIDSRQLLCEYIYKKHGVEMDSTTLGCNGGMSQFYILVDGTLLPCSPAGTSMGYSVNQTYLKEISPPNLLVNSVDEIENSEYLAKFYNYTHNKVTYDNLKPCDNCKYDCLPCPLLYKDSRIVEECIYAKKEIEKLDRKMMERRLFINPNIRIIATKENPKLVDFISQDIFELEDLGAFIWNKINGSYTGEMIVDIILSQLEKVPSKEIVKEDVLEFLYELMNLNFIQCE